MTPFDSVPQRACEDGPLCVPDITCIAQLHLGYDVRLVLTQA